MRLTYQHWNSESDLEYLLPSQQWNPEFELEYLLTSSHQNLDLEPENLPPSLYPDAEDDLVAANKAYGFSVAGIVFANSESSLTKISKDAKVSGSC